MQISVLDFTLDETEQTNYSQDGTVLS